MNLARYLDYQPLKALPRTGWGMRGVKNPETVAAHVWGVAVLVMELAPVLAPEIDLLKALKMALHHDTAEIKAGDITPHDGVTDEEKYARELAAMKELAGEGEMLALWNEMEEAASPAARFVKAMDCLDMTLRALKYVQERALTMAQAEEFINYSKKRFEKMGYPALVAEVEKLEKAVAG